MKLRSTYGSFGETRFETLVPGRADKWLTETLLFLPGTFADDYEERMFTSYMHWLAGYGVNSLPVLR